MGWSEKTTQNTTLSLTEGRGAYCAAVSSISGQCHSQTEQWQMLTQVKRLHSSNDWHCLPEHRPRMLLSQTILVTAFLALYSWKNKFTSCHHNRRNIFCCDAIFGQSFSMTLWPCWVNATISGQSAKSCLISTMANRSHTNKDGS